MSLLTLFDTAKPNPWLANLAAYYKLDGDAQDASGNGNHLTNNNGVSYVTGKVGQAAQFVRASSQYLSVASNAILQTGNIDFTVALWCYLDSLQTFTLIQKGNEFRLLYDPGNTTFFWLVQADTGNVLSTSYSLAATWALVIAEHDSVNDVLRIRVNNGSVVSAAFSAGITAGGSALTIGGPSNPMNGRIDNVAIWKNRILTAAERTALYNGGAGRDLLTNP